MSESHDSYGPGAFSIIYPGRMISGTKKLRAYKAFRDRIHTAVGDPERQRPEIASAAGKLARLTDSSEAVLKHVPDKGVTIVDPATVAEEARFFVRDCGPATAAALGEVVFALQRPRVDLGNVYPTLPSA